MQVIASTKQSKPYIVGVAGGSGSGKTHFAQKLQAALGEENCSLIYQDNFYFDQSKRFDYDGGSVNFDHPDSLEFSLLADVLQKIKSGNEVQIPIYDFVTHSRKSDTLKVLPTPIVLVDGILIFHPSEVREQLDDLVFFDTPEELRFQRRLERDVKERGRKPEGVHQQFFQQVKPMHDQFVQPSRFYAHTIVKDIGEFPEVLEAYRLKLSSFIKP
jgi:uridine kinase